MANTKLDRIERDIEKTRAKILEQQKKLKDLEAQKVEEENAQILATPVYIRRTACTVL